MPIEEGVNVSTENTPIEIHPHSGIISKIIKVGYLQSDLFSELELQQSRFFQ